MSMIEVQAQQSHNASDPTFLSFDPMSRPQIGIDRLPQRRMSTEPRESMNCKSCRKRKIKCNRLRPACEACQVFACPCIYDAVPKKRGPKTDVLEALLKRVDGLEKRLRTEGKEDSPTSSVKEAIVEAMREGEEKKKQAKQQDVPRSTPDSTTISNASSTANGNTSRPSPPSQQQISPQQQPPAQLYPELLLDTYFARIHGKPYHILDESSTRQRLLIGQLPSYLAYAIYAVSARFASQYGGYNSAVQMGREYTRQARTELDIDHPSIETLQTLLLLSQAMYQEGQGKKSYMYLTSGISMAFALNLHRELPTTLRVAPAEREGRRRLFWACYLLDRFAACGSKRPSLIADECVVLRLPCSSLQNGTVPSEGEYFQAAGNLQYMATGKPGHGSTSMLIGIVRILGITNRYLAAGGVKGDSHFPWHALSNLSKIRSDLDIWASETQDTFSSLDSLFGQPDSAILVLSKLIYHLIHCLIYRPFLPVDLAELSGTTQHQSWQIEATNICFLHANAIAELVEIGKTSSSILDWPSFVGYCVCTAGTIHVHGAHYRGRDGEVFSMSADFLSREMQQLSELRYIWTGAQHQRDTLQAQYGAHSELVKSLASNPMRFSAVFHLEDFFDRYPGHFFDGAHITFADIAVDETLSQPPNGRRPSYRNPSVQGYPNPTFYPLQTPTAVPSSSPSTNGPSRKRRATAPPKPISPSSIVPATYNGFQSPDTYQSPYLTSNYQPQQHQQQQQQQNGMNGLNVHTDHSYPTSHSSLSAGVNASPNFTFTASPSLHSPHSHSTLHTQQIDSAHPSHPHPHSHLDNKNNNGYDPMFTMPAHFDDIAPNKAGTDGTMSANGSDVGGVGGGGGDVGDGHSAGGGGERDPFLSLLEQLAENEQSRGGPSELDFFLSGGGGGSGGAGGRGDVDFG